MKTNRKPAKLFAFLLAMCLLISCVPGQALLFTQAAFRSISVADESETVTNAASDTFKIVWKYKYKVIQNRTETFTTEAEFIEKFATATTGTFYVYCNYTLSENLTVPAGVTLMLPMNATDTDGTTKGTTSNGGTREAWANEASYLYATVTIPEGISLTVNGTLLVGGVFGYPDRSSQGHTSGAYSQIICNGTLTVNGILDVYGLITGTGTTSINSGSTMKIPFLLNDFDGGTNSVAYYNAGIFPFHQFAVNNVQTRCVMRYGCTVIGKGRIYFNTIGDFTDSDVTLIATSDANSAALFMSGGSTITATYDSSKRVSIMNGETNLDDFGKTTLSTTGGISAGNIKLSYSVYSFDSSSFVLSVPYTFDVNITAGTMNIPNKYRLMPGCNFTVGKNGTLNISGELQVADGWNQPVLSNKRYPSSAELHNAGFSQSANLIVNGTMNVQSGGVFAGIVQNTNPASAKIVIDANATLSGNFTSGTVSSEKNADNTVNYSLSARTFTGDSLQPLEAGKTYRAYSADTWILPSYTMTVVGTEVTTTINETLQGKWCCHNYGTTTFTWAEDPAAEFGWTATATRTCPNCGNEEAAAVVITRYSDTMILATATYTDGTTATEYKYAQAETPITISAVEGSGVAIDETNKYIVGIPVGAADVDAYLTASESGVTFSVTNAGSAIATGSTVDVMKNGRSYGTYTIIVLGDIDGDGVCTGMDAVLIDCIVNGLLSIDNTDASTLYAADVNTDGAADDTDVRYLVSAGLSVGSYFNAEGQIVNGSIITYTTDEELGNNE